VLPRRRPRTLPTAGSRSRRRCCGGVARGRARRLVRAPDGENPGQTDAASRAWPTRRWMRDRSHWGSAPHCCSRLSCQPVVSLDTRHLRHASCRTVARTATACVSRHRHRGTWRNTGRLTSDSDRQASLRRMRVEASELDHSLTIAHQHRSRHDRLRLSSFGSECAPPAASQPECDADVCSKMLIRRRSL
jgi:hypothetical protein